MPGSSPRNPVTSQKAAANGGRGTGTAQDPVPASRTTDPQAAPPKANAANTKAAISGLMKALNDYEKKLVPKTFEVANEYSIEFLPSTLGDSLVTKPGTVNKSRTPTVAPGNAANSKLPEKQSMEKDLRLWSFQAGTPIVQIIDMIMRNSSFVTDQARVAIDENTQQTKPQAPLGDMAWYKISMEATPLKFDNKRRDFAYKIKYLITPYAINNMVSEYFPEGTFRGLHKVYDYWFTGRNTQVLNFEQNFNKLWVQTITDPDINLSTAQSVNVREIWTRVSQAASAQSRQGAENKTNELGASASDYLYSVSDQGTVKLRIVGDPAWLQQGEVVNGASARGFNFNAFNDDGTINFDSSQVCFSINWNRPVDYDLQGNGLMNPVNSYQGNQAIGGSQNAQESLTYRATMCKSHFSKGRFEQDLEGILFIQPGEIKPNETRPASTSSSSAAEDINQSAAETARLAAANARGAPRVSKNTPWQTSVTGIEPTSAIAKGQQPLLAPPTELVNPTLAQLQSSPVYIQARRSGATPQAALDAARSAFAAGTNNYEGAALPGIRINGQIMSREN